MSRPVRATAIVLSFSTLALATPARASPVPPPQPPAAAGESVGLYPLQLPGGQEALQDRLLGQLHDGAASLPGLKAFDLIPRSACFADEGGCLAAAARSASLSQIVSGQVDATSKGYKFTLRLFDARNGALLEQQSAVVEGGPLDLAGGLEHGVCALLGAAPCVGALAVRVEEGASGARLTVDGQDQGVLPLAKPLSLTVGRHLVRAGADERRVRVSYHRDTRLLCAQRAGAWALLDDAPDAAPAAPASALSAAQAERAVPAISSQGKVGRLLLAGGAALLVSAAGLEWYSRAQASALDDRYRNGALTNFDKPAYGRVSASGAAALLTGAVGLGALGVGGIVLLGAPSGAAVQGRF